MNIAKRIIYRVSKSVPGGDKLFDMCFPTQNKWPRDKLIAGAMKKYKRLMGYEFDFHHPVLFTEKLQWYRIMYDRPQMERIVDKYLFKGYIEEQLGQGYTIPMFGAWETIEDLRKDWDHLPNKLVLKSTLQSDGKFIKVIHDRASINFDELSKEIKNWLNPRNTLINSFCRAYYKAVPRILAEEYVAQINDQLYDYKLFCFDGKPYCFYAATDHFGEGEEETYPISFYDLNWNQLDVSYGQHKKGIVEKPVHMDEMIDIAKRLSSGFPFIRVDFFDLPEKLYLAELTLYPGGGVTPYHPESFNRELGELFRLPGQE